MRTARKIKLCGSPTTEELKKKHSSRLAGGAERMHSKVATGGPGWTRQQLEDWEVSHMCADNQEEQLGSKTDHATQGSNVGK